MRVSLLTLLAIVPRIFIALLLGSVGVIFLLRTKSLDELILNCVALTTVLNADELIYSAIMPRKVEVLLSLCEPIELPVRRCHSILPVCRLTLIFVPLVAAMMF